MTPLGALSDADLALIADLIGEHPVFRVYLAAGLEAERRGASDRFARIGRSRAGVALGVAFDAADVVTLIGRLDADEEIGLASPRRTELHLEAAAARRVTRALAGRAPHQRGMRYYRLDGRPARSPDDRCRRVDRSDLSQVRALFDAHYVEAIFSAW
ncbi:MAG TPA: hypothetical protein VKT30_05730, partial [Caulobacteraceae bacterium]|nr:hypothetical protein [Caulobacteraceae bacterium]